MLTVFRFSRTRRQARGWIDLELKVFNCRPAERLKAKTASRRAPSTAASSEIVILTWRLLQTSREAMPSSRGPVRI
jgi:hypothetical protein